MLGNFLIAFKIIMNCLRKTNSLLSKKPLCGFNCCDRSKTVWACKKSSQWDAEPYRVICHSLLVLGGYFLTEWPIASLHFVEHQSFSRRRHALCLQVEYPLRDVEWAHQPRTNREPVLAWNGSVLDYKEHRRLHVFFGSIHFYYNLSPSLIFFLHQHYVDELLQSLNPN